MDASLKSRLTLLCEDVGTPYAAFVKKSLHDCDYGAIVRRGVNPSDYTDAYTYLNDASLHALFVKNVDVKFGVDTSAVALQKWFESEHMCYETNRRFSNYLEGYYPSVDWRVVEFLHRVAKRVARILGPLPREIKGSWGPGTTYEADQLIGESVKTLTAVDKQQASAYTSDANLIAQHPDVSDRYVDPYRFEPYSDVVRIPVRGNRWASVKKNGLTDRSIGMEPGVNVYLQLGVAAAMLPRLKLIGQDIPTGADRHRLLAKEALAKGLATLDETMASDLWATYAVKFLLQYASGWFELLDSLRSRFTRVDSLASGSDTSGKGTWVRLEKFSSMGNGFTFPLQTILYYAITREICGEDAIVSVFGDDIICPADKARDVMMALRFFGHKPNESKSFIDGPFRESCGEDFFNGIPVRPAFLKAWPVTPPDWIKFANSLWRRNRSAPFAKLRLWVIRQIPLKYRLGGPEELGDAVLHSRPWRTRVEHSIRYVRGVTAIARSVHSRYFNDRDVASVILRFISVSEVDEYLPSTVGGVRELAAALDWATDQRKRGFLSYRGKTKTPYIPTRGVTGWKVREYSWS